MDSNQLPEKMLFYTARTEEYRGEPVESVDRVFEASGDFVSAIFRVMPQSNDPDPFNRIVKQMQSVKNLVSSCMICFSRRKDDIVTGVPGRAEEPHRESRPDGH